MIVMVVVVVVVVVVFRIVYDTLLLPGKVFALFLEVLLLVLFEAIRASIALVVDLTKVFAVHVLVYERSSCSETPESGKRRRRK